MPTLVVTRCKALACGEFYILMVFIGQENTIWNSITMIKEGTKAVKTVIS
jgi:hypothetical protein